MLFLFECHLQFPPNDEGELAQLEQFVKFPHRVRFTWFGFDAGRAKTTANMHKVVRMMRFISIVLVVARRRTDAVTLGIRAVDFS